MFSYAKQWRWRLRALVLLCATQVLLGGWLCFTGGKAFKGRATFSEAVTISRSQSEDDLGHKSSPFTEDWSGFLASPCDTVVVLCGARPGNVGATYCLCCLGNVCALVVVGLTFGKAQKALELSGVKPGEGVTCLVAPPEQMDTREVLLALRDADFHLVGLTAHGEGVKALWDVSFRPGLALVFGREHDGIPPEAEELLHEELEKELKNEREAHREGKAQGSALLIAERQRNNQLQVLRQTAAGDFRIFKKEDLEKQLQQEI